MLSSEFTPIEVYYNDSAIFGIVVVRGVNCQRTPPHGLSDSLVKK